MVQLKPEQEVQGHPLGPASLVLSPHCLWLVSVGRDGLLCVRETASMVKAFFALCISCKLYLIHVFYVYCNTAAASAGAVHQVAVPFIP